MHHVVFQSPSLRGSGRFTATTATATPATTGFNPLHCGAVVASSARARARRSATVRFQSPSLRGSGRFPPREAVGVVGPGSFNPLHCGAVVASPQDASRSERPTIVSIPFIAGQWSLLFAFAAVVLAASAFQSPSLRGSGRFELSEALQRRCTRMFQSPSLRGSGRFSSSQPRRRSSSPLRFNPLHCGAVVASVAPRSSVPRSPNVSIPFIAGQWSLHVVCY